MAPLLRLLVSTTSLVYAVLAAPAPVTLPDARVKHPLVKRSTSGSYPIQNVIANDFARLSYYNNRASGKSDNIAQRNGVATNVDAAYVAQVEVGGQSFSLIIDTGSSNTWVGAGTAYSGTGTSTGAICYIGYGSGSVYGTEWISSVMAADIMVKKQSFCVAEAAFGFDGVDGIIGLGPVDLTEYTVTNATTVPTWLDNLKSQRSISTEAIGIHFHPESGSDTDDANGELDIGGVNTELFTGKLTYTPKSTVAPYNTFWSVNTVNLKYEKTTLTGAATAIVDTGSTLMYISTAAYNAFLSSSGGTTDPYSDLPYWTTAPTGTFTVTIGSVGYALKPFQYLIPQAQFGYYQLTTPGYYSWIKNGGSVDGDLNFILGQKFLENFYTVFDTTNSRIGFAPNA